MISVRWSQAALPLLIASSLLGQSAESSPLRRAATPHHEWSDPGGTELPTLVAPDLIETSSVSIPTVPDFDVSSAALLAPARFDSLALVSHPPLLLASLNDFPLIQATSLVTGQTTPLLGDSADPSSTPTDHRIPEPGSYLLLLTGAIGLLARRRLRSRSNLSDSRGESSPA
ncbi:MAG: PEP-CTERM sorting domain-containing protein [Isosphaeraceae bacterium]